MQVRVKDGNSLSAKLIGNYRWRFGILMVVVAAVLIWLLFIAAQPTSPIPKSVQSGVNFPVYYPNKTTLPAGYGLRLNSIQLLHGGVVVFSIGYGGGQNIIISEQSMPDSNTISHFTADYIPIHTYFSSPNGQATFGAYTYGNGLRSVVSLPIKSGPWIIATAPASIAKPSLIKVVDSLIKS